jgi:hypothetical protein
LRPGIAGFDPPFRHLDRLIVIGQSRAIVVLCRIGDAAEAIGIGIVGINLDLSGKIVDARS